MDWVSMCFNTVQTWRILRSEIKAFTSITNARIATCKAVNLSFNWLSSEIYRWKCHSAHTIGTFALLPTHAWLFVSVAAHRWFFCRSIIRVPNAVQQIYVLCIDLRDPMFLPRSLQICTFLILNRLIYARWYILYGLYSELARSKLVCVNPVTVLCVPVSLCIYLYCTCTCTLSE